MCVQYFNFNYTLDIVTHNTDTFLNQQTPQPRLILIVLCIYMLMHRLKFVYVSCRKYAQDIQKSRLITA